MQHHLIAFRNRLTHLFFGPAYHPADHNALRPRGSARGIRLVTAVVGLLWLLLWVGDTLGRFWQHGPKSLIYMQGAHVFSEQPNQSRQLWPLRPIIAKRLNVNALSAPYAAHEDTTRRWITTDAYGFRKTSGGPFAVTLCGDSFFINDLIADSLASHLGKQVGNASIDGRGTLAMARLLDAPAPAFQHTRVVVWLRVEAGINTDEFVTWMIQRRGELKLPTNPLKRTYLSWRSSVLWPANLDGYLTESAPIKAPMQHVASEISWHIGNSRDTTVLLGRQQLTTHVSPMQFLSEEQGVHHTPTSDIELAAIADGIAQVKEDLQKKGIQLIFAAAPDKSTIYRERLPATVTYHPGFTARLYFALRQRGVQTIDLETRLRQQALANPTTALYYTTDTHWNPQGQALAAKILADSLQTLLR
ncbi:alginate O-acetyltransferase AlgX-related protein [Hymenobacter canadensis]|uniref:AlgX/AlgJ SGNH hydrolase-like domain-containing protein n=1 Tax=Hymenobacter canadensis TaxID=2999067 RepID=A0ABY7LNE2_9BACT|nr:hypothetical protein [Hymenobacter canadensis]WBA41960.1 hypothetical protein O3303_00010 [Hymenobacter canadensis]